MDTICDASVLLPSILLLVVVLIIWARQWLHTYQTYSKQDDISRYCNYGLSLVYLSIVILLVGFVFAVVSYVIEGFSYLANISIGLFATALFFTIAQSVQSAISALYKFQKDKSVDKPYHIYTLRNLRVALFSILGVGLIIFVGIEIYLFILL